ncbi:PAS domain-containing protein, partial [Sphingomonas sp. Leaf10]|uniref:PAS domain-containing protein n=1 Tax=Sphingomonas sp. Leaf10 TaxID=1735676 RepID=UPI0006F8844A
MNDMLAAFDWSTTPLGPRGAWPVSLRTAVDIMMASGHAMCLAWGPERTFLYNDAYIPILGKRHPFAFGVTFAEAWPDVWEEIEPLVDKTFAGETSTFSDMPLLMARNGYPEDTWWRFSYSPVRDEGGAVAGLLNVTIETTDSVKAERDRSAASTELQRSEAKWRRLFETLAEGFILGEVVRDADGRIVDWRYEEVNDAWYDLVGVEHGCAVGRTIREVLPGIEDEWVLEFARVVETGQAIRFTRQVGDLHRWYDGVCQPAGEDWFTVIFLEVTDRILADRRRDALSELGRALTSLVDPKEILRAATEIIGRALDVGRVGYGTVAEDGETFDVPVDWTAEGYTSLTGTHRLSDYGSYAEDLRQGSTIAIPDIRLNPRTATNTAPLNAVAARSMVNRPIVENGRTVAILYVNDGQPRDWSPEELAFIADAGDRIRTALERRRAEQEAWETAAFMQSVLTASTDCIKVLELDGSLSFMSEGGMAVMEISDFNAVAGCPWPDFWQGAGNAEAKAAIAAAQNGEARNFIGKADTYRGTPKWWHVAVSPIAGADGRVDRILSVSRDITDLRESEEQRERFVRLAENSRDFVGMAHLDGRVFYMNNAARALVGLEDADITRFAMTDFFPPEQVATVVDDVLPAVQRDGHWVGELCFRHFGTGASIPVVYSVFPITDASGAVIGYGTVTRDHREKKRAEEDMQLMNGELAHRLKNVLTVVQSVAQQTLRSAPDTATASRDLGSRLMALGSATDVLTGSSWRSADLGDVARGALAPHGALGERIV